MHCAFETDDLCGYTTHDFTGDETVFEHRHGYPLSADHTTNSNLGKE